MKEKDFEDYLPHWKSSPNPSNQNFHNKIIRALSINNKVNVISFRPFSRGLCDLKYLPYEEKEDGNINWIYLKIHRNIFKKLYNIETQFSKAIKKYLTDDTIVFVDTINTLCVHCAKRLIKKYNPKTIGIVTDSPSNISYTTKSFTKYLLNNASNYSGYIALTEGLNNLYNKNNHESIIMDGIVDENNNKTIDKTRPYFFFGGALMKKYGIYNLIEAFKKLDDKKFDLYICGHHEDLFALKTAIDNNPNIKYMGCLPINKVKELEASSFALVNPRPYSEDLDRYSIPSKTLEYLSSGKLVISVKNTRLQKLFPNEIIWAKSSDVDDLCIALKHAIELDKDAKSLIELSGKQKVFELFSMEKTLEKIEGLIKKI